MVLDPHFDFLTPNSRYRACVSVGGSVPFCLLFPDFVVSFVLVTIRECSEISVKLLRPRRAYTHEKSIYGFATLDAATTYVRKLSI